jgi:HK97 family phage prohead protease
MDRSEFALREVKLAQDAAEGMKFSGYGAVFSNIDSYGDVIQPGAFAESIAAARKTGNWPAMLSQHGGYGMTADDMTPIGIWTDMSEDGVGLKIEGKLADTQRGRDAYTLLKMERPALNGLSIGYVAKEWTARSKPDEPRRTLKKIDLYEISLVTFPANPKARIAQVKSEAGLGVKQAEEALREAGFSRTEAKAIVAKGFKALGRREADASDPSAALQRLISKLKS